MSSWPYIFFVCLFTHSIICDSSYVVSNNCTNYGNNCYLSIENALNNLQNNTNTIYIDAGQYFIANTIHMNKDIISIIGNRSNVTYIAINSTINTFLNCSNSQLILKYLTIDQSTLFNLLFVGISTIHIESVNIINAATRWIFNDFVTIHLENCLFSKSNLSFTVFHNAEITGWGICDKQWVLDTRG
eukprot:55556_1